MSDLIRREDALSKFEKACTFDSVDKNGMKRGEIKTALTWEGIRNILENIPSAETERKKGEWMERVVYSMTIMDYQHAKCSVCGKYLTTPYQYYFDNYNFCPNCGADMRGDR